MFVYRFFKVLFRFFCYKQIFNNFSHRFSLYVVMNVFVHKFLCKSRLNLLIKVFTITKKTCTKQLKVSSLTILNFIFNQLLQ